MYSRSLCDSNLQGTNKRNDKESRWESFLLCSTNFSSFFLFFSIFRMTSTNRHHIILFYWTWRTNCIYPLVRKRVLFFQMTEGLNYFGVIASFRIISVLRNIQNSSHIIYIVCLDLNLWILVKKMNEITLCKHSYKFLFLVRFLQYWFMWPHV